MLMSPRQSDTVMKLNFFAQDGFYTLVWFVFLSIQILCLRTPITYIVLKSFNPSPRVYANTK